MLKSLLEVVSICIACISFSFGQSPPPRELMWDCLGEQKGRCGLIKIGPKTVTKQATQTKRGLENIDFYSLETRIYERLQSVKRPKGCEGFKLFPRLVAKDDARMTLTTERFGAPLEVCLYPR